MSFDFIRDISLCSRPNGLAGWALRNPLRLFLGLWHTDRNGQRSLSEIFRSVCNRPGNCILFHFLILLIFNFSIASAQSSKDNGKIIGIGIGAAALYGGSMVVLNQYWYANYPKSDFHFFNDNAEWMQMDKFGHFFTSYYEGYCGMTVFEWAGMPAKKAMWYGGTWGLLMQTPIEIMDGFSSEWGFSWGDELANTLGSALLIAQQYAFGQQLIKPKFSYMPTEFAAMNPNEFGTSPIENGLKDYNGQNYWFSYPFSSIAPLRSFPTWFSISIGFGAKGMLRGTAVDQKNGPRFAHYERSRQFLLSFDINTANIYTKSVVANDALTAISWIKVPSPTIEYSRYRGFKAHLLYF